jgi:formamidopyrimidine-DNA glycosylase
LPINWEVQLLIDAMKQAVKDGIHEFYEEQEEQEEEQGLQRDVAVFKLPCKYCSQPITSGQTFILFHSDCLDKEQALR